MNVLLYISIFWIIYGILGLFGVQANIPKEFKGQIWTQKYIQKIGLSWLMIGIPWIVYYLLYCNNRLRFTFEVLILVVLSLPSIIFTFVIDKKYKALIKDCE